MLLGIAKHLQIAPRPLVLLATVAGIALSLYWPAIQNGYVWDDLTLFVQSPNLRTGGVTWDVLSQPVIQGTTYFRPLVLWSFAAEFRMFGVDAAVSHTVNLTIYVLNVVLVFLLAGALFPRMHLAGPDLRAFLAATLYAVHPSLVESTVWVSGRFDQFVTTFVLCALLAEVLIRASVARAGILAAFFLLALMSKEAAICTPALLLLQRLAYDRIGGEGAWAATLRVCRSEWLAIATLAAAFGVYMLLRVSSLDRVLHSPNLEGVKSAAGHISLVLNTAAFYAREIVLPFVSLSPLHPYSASALTSQVGLLRALAAALLCLVIATLAARNIRAGLQALSIIVALLPVLNIVPLTLADSIGNDRFLTLPLALCALLVASFSFQDYSWLRKRAQVVVGAIVIASWVILSTLTVRATTPLWRDGISLWTWAYEKHPDSDTARTTLLIAAQEERRFGLMKSVFETMRAEGPLTPRQQLIYGGYLVEIGEVEEGKNYILGVLHTTTPFHKIAKEDLRNLRSQELLYGALAHGYHALAVAQIKQNDLAGALESATISLWYRPTAPTVLLQQSNILLAMGRESESEAIFRRAVDLSLPVEQANIHSGRAALLQALARQRGKAVTP